LDRVYKIWAPFRKLFATPGVPSWLRTCFPLVGFAFIYPALPTCLVAYVQKSDFHLINVFCEVIAVKKCTMSSAGSLLLFCIA